MSQSILIIEDECAIRDMVRFALSSSAYELIEASDFVKAKQVLASSLPDLILLDWMLPNVSGIHVLRWLKKHDAYMNIPVIMLTARAEEENKIHGLEAGADDYVTKPFSPQELIVRIKVVLRRGPIIQPCGTLKAGRLEINTYTHEVSVDGSALNLTPVEYKLLSYLISHKAHVHTRESLLNQVWGIDNYLDERTVDVQIKRLRKRLKACECEHYIHTVRGFGYQFRDSHEKVQSPL